MPRHWRTDGAKSEEGDGGHAEKFTDRVARRYPHLFPVPIILPMRLRLTIDGMYAVHAKRAVFTALAGVDGVRSADVEMGSATVDCTGPVSEETLRAAVELAGCRVTAVVRELPTL